MSSRTYEYVERISTEDRVAIIDSYEQFERDGFIGDEPVRVHARALMRELGLDGDSHITMWMNMLAFECYRHFYHKNSQPTWNQYNCPFVSECIRVDN